MSTFIKKQNLKRIICFGMVMMMVSALSACNKGNSIKYSTSSVSTETTDAQTVPQTAASTATTQVNTPAGDISVGWCKDDDGKGIRIRAGAGVEYNGIGGLKNGEKVTVLGKEGDWYKIKFAKGKDGVGYVNAQFISATEIIDTAETTTTIAAQ